MNSQDSSKTDCLDGLSLKMFQDSSIVMKEKISDVSLKSWMNSGMAYRGEFSMRNILEHHKDVEESTLWEVMETSAPLEYFLKREQLELWISRAWEKNFPVPEELSNAIEMQISFLSNTQVSVGKQVLDRKLKDLGTTVKPTPSIQEEAPMLFVRRLMPSECERLQGFPKGWTETDIEQ